MMILLLLLLYYAFPIEGVLVATYLLSVEALPHCRLGVANKSCVV